jgi:hypothetical protein
MPVINIFSSEIPTLFSSSMRFVMRSLRMDTGPDGRTECCKLLKRLHDMIPSFRKKSRFRLGCIEKFSITHKKKSSLFIYVSRILFIILILKGKEILIKRLR